MLFGFKIQLLINWDFLQIEHKVQSQRIKVVHMNRLYNTAYCEGGMYIVKRFIVLIIFCATMQIQHSRQKFHKLFFKHFICHLA